jgi:hypothetical protein
VSGATDAVIHEYICTCSKFTERCFRRAGVPGGQCFPCSAGNCGLGGNHGYGALKPEEVILQAVVPPALHQALDRLDLYLSRFSLHDTRALNEESEQIEVPIRLLAKIRDVWWAYKRTAEDGR